MGVLTHDVILDYIDRKIITIDPFDPTRVGPASVDLILDKQFRVFKNLHEPLNLDSETFDPDVFSEVKTVEKSILLHPGQTILGVTVENIILPPTLCGWIQGRSRFARVGLMVHISSSFIQPGIDNKQVLELFNAGPMPINIFPGISVCQILFEETVGSASYHGKYQHQDRP